VADYYSIRSTERQLYQMAIDGMLDQLHDPYSVFLKPGISAAFRSDDRDLLGVGYSDRRARRLDHRRGAVAYPAERAGVRPATASFSSLVARRRVEAGSGGEGAAWARPAPSGAADPAPPVSTSRSPTSSLGATIHIRSVDRASR